MMETQKAEKERLRGEVEPPTALASRTCAKIWETLDNEKQDFAPNSGIFLDSAFFAPESVLPPSFWLQTSEPNTSQPVEGNCDEGKRAIPKAAKKIEAEEDDELPPRSSHGIGLIASVSVGMVIAVFLFPMLEFAKRSTRSYVKESWMTEINRRVDQYEQIHGNTSRSEELQPINLALSGWQELYSDVFKPVFSPPTTVWFTMEPSNTLVVESFLMTSPFVPVDEGRIAPLRSAPFKAQAENTTIQGKQFSFLLDFENGNKPISLDTNGLSEQLLLSIPSWEGTARSAYGRDVLIKDGRVFFRVLPNRE